jgi:hypothetical protein
LHCAICRRDATPAPQLPAFDVLLRTGTMAALKGSKTIEI